ncbi:MAG: response regulator transcription factor [Bacteroidota bacterium]
MIANPVGKPSIILVDDHLVFRQGLKSLLTIENIATVICEAADGRSFIELLKQNKPDLVLMDIDMPEIDGMDVTREALKLCPELRIIAFTMFGDEEYYFKMIDLGVKGFILKSSGISELEKAIHTVMDGKNYFSNELVQKIFMNYGRRNSQYASEAMGINLKEIAMLKQICCGLNVDQIAASLHLSVKTVRNYQSKLLKKTKSMNSSGLILFALRNRVFDF